MKTYLLRGVPNSVAMDGWWLSGGQPRRPRPAHDATGSPQWWHRAGALAALIALADLLLWQAAPGLSLAVFGIAVLGTGWVYAGRRGTAGIGLALLLFLPVIERVQALSVVFWLAGLALGAAWIATARWPGLSAALRFLLHAPTLFFHDLHATMTAAPRRDVHSGARAAFLGWFLPLGLGLLFLSLLVEANPMFERWLRSVTLGSLEVDRIAFWLGIGFLAWPFLSLHRLEQRLKLGPRTPRARSLPAMFNAASVRRSLVLFNVVFAVQTLSDIAIFSGGAALPDGMSYAEYAHRGAYPLLATALLAGLFAIAARPFTTGNHALRAALLAWMGQTLLLVLSSLLRLDSYVSVYGLTHLRLAALIWMGTVAVGIVLVIAQILRHRPVGWLLRRCTVLGIGTLYLCSFTSFAATVATYNLTHDVIQDQAYLCALDGAALPVILDAQRVTERQICAKGHLPVFDPPRDWREWGFRDWRTARSLSKIPAPGTAWPTF